MKLLYSLVTIEDPMTPLAAAPKSTFASLLPWITGIAIILILVLVGLATIYVLKCNKVRRQISYIVETQKIDCSRNLPKWNLKELRTIKEDLESLVV